MQEDEAREESMHKQRWRKASIDQQNILTVSSMKHFLFPHFCYSLLSTNFTDDISKRKKYRLQFSHFSAFRTKNSKFCLLPFCLLEVKAEDD